MSEASGSRGEAGDVVIGVRDLRKVFGTQSAVRQLLKGAAADNAAIHDLLVEYLGDLPMIDAPGQLVRCFVVTTQQTERLEVRLIRTYKHPSKGRDQSEEWSQWEAGMATPPIARFGEDGRTAIGAVRLALPRRHLAKKTNTPQIEPCRARLRATRAWRPRSTPPAPRPLATFTCGSTAYTPS